MAGFVARLNKVMRLYEITSSPSPFKSIEELAKETDRMAAALVRKQEAARKRKATRPPVPLQQQDLEAHQKERKEEIEYLKRKLGPL